MKKVKWYFHDMRIMGLGQDISRELVFSPCLVKGWEHAYRPECPPWFETVVWSE
jgi:hypothetical protein